MHTTPRLGLDDFPPALQELLSARIERLGYLGEFFQLAAHQPDALGHFIGLTESLKAALEPRLTESIALTVASRTDNHYERVQHERLALATGLDADEVNALLDGETAQHETFSPVERGAVELARCIASTRGLGCPSAYERLLDLAGPEVAVACLLTASQCLAHATIVNTWRLRAPVTEIRGGVER